MENILSGKILSLFHKKPVPISAFPIDERPRLIADSIAAIVILLMAIGTVFVFSASLNIEQGIELEKFYDYTGLRQILFFPLACLIMYIFSCIDFHSYSMEKGWFKNPVLYLLLISIGLLVLIIIQRFFEIFPKDGFIPYNHKT